MQNRLREEINRSIEWLKKTHEMPVYKDVLFVIDNHEIKTINGFNRTIIHKEKIMDPAAFAPVFDNLIEKGYGWINFHCAGIYGDSLIYTIELPNYISDISSDKVSINLSGPAFNPKTNMPDWDFRIFYEVV